MSKNVRSNVKLNSVSTKSATPHAHDDLSVIGTDYIL